MICADQCITVKKRIYDGEADIETEVSTVLDGVSVYTGLAAIPSSGGITSSDVVKIRIPYALPDTVSLEVGGKIVVGGKQMTILRVHDNTMRRFKPHWYMEAK